MRTFFKVATCFLLLGMVQVGFAQQPAASAKQTTGKKTKKKSRKAEKAVDNKIAVSDEAQTADKGTKKAAKKNKGISNK